MKKVFLSMMLTGALLMGGTAYAQTETDATTGASTQNKENVKGAKGNRQGNKPSSKDMRGSRARFNPFDGVQLTDDQQQRLQVLQQGLGPVELSKEQQERIPQNKDLTPEQRKQLMQEREAKKLESKKNYLNGVKEILTPDQYEIFLENVYLYTPQDQGNGPGKFKSGKIKAHGEGREKKEMKDKGSNKQ